MIAPPTEESSPEEKLLLELAAIDASFFTRARRRTLKIDARLIGTERVSFWALERDPLAISCEDGYVTSSDRYESGTRILARQAPRYFDALHEQRIIAVQDVYADPRTRELADFYLKPHGITSMLDAPVWLRGKLAGVLCHEHVGPPKRWTSRDKELAIFAAQSLSRALLGRLQSRATFLGNATMLLTASLEIEEIPQRLARLTVPLLGDWCVIDVLEVGRLRRMAATHVDPEKMPVLIELDPSHHGVLFATEEATRTGEPLLLRDLSPETLRVLCPPDQAKLVWELGTETVLAVPLVAHGKTLGAIAFGGGAGRRATSDDLELARELSERAAVAIENAWLHFRIQRALQLREEFLAVAAHELHTPLSSLQLALQAVSSGQIDLSADAAQKGIRIAGRQVTRLRRLVRDLLSVTRMRTGSLDLVLETVNVGELVHEIVEEYGPDIERAGCEVDMRTEEAVVGHWDRARLAQVISNLLSNGLKFGRGAPISIEVQQSEGFGVLIVESRGIGIEKDELRRIFDPFYRAVSIQEYGGLGLGLYIVRQVVEALGGTVRAQSLEGKRARFIVKLPVAGPQAEGGWEP